MQYTIRAVDPRTRTYQTKFGDMVSYKVLFEGDTTPVEISQKATTPAPKEGDVVEGTIDTSGQYGPKFKKEFGGGFGGGSLSTPSASRRNDGGRNSDPFTMYLSYAKDVAVALIASKNGYDAEKFAEVLDDVITGGKTLYGSRPGAEAESEPVAKPQAEPEQPFGSQDVVATVEDVDNFLPEDIAKLFDKDS